MPAIDPLPFSLHAVSKRPPICDKIQSCQKELEIHMSPHAHIRSLPPEGAHTPFGAAHQEV
jgi:hypothetical protein